MTARRRLKQAEIAQLWLRQKGKCGCGCGERLIAGQTDAEHTIPLWMGGADDISNMTLYRRKPCHQEKSARESPLRAKCLRQKAFHETGRSRARKGRPLVSRGFDKTLRKRMDGTVERRA